MGFGDEIRSNYSEMDYVREELEFADLLFTLTNHKCSQMLVDLVNVNNIHISSDVLYLIIKFSQMFTNDIIHLRIIASYFISELLFTFTNVLIPL